MRFVFVFILVAIVAFIAFVVFSYMEQMFLGIILAWIMIIWPVVFWLVSRVAGSYGKEKEESKRIKQDIIDEHPETEEKTSKESVEGETEEEFVVPQKKDVNVNKAREELEKLKKSSELLDEEKKEGLLSEESYNELKKQNKEAMEKLEEEIAKAGGEIREKKVYCRKGKHYINVRDCLPSKIPGYVICQEHNEEIRVE
jgi:MFS superfamily sulfate permease-like transporter